MAPISSSVKDPLLYQPSLRDGFADFDVGALPPPVEESRWKKWGLRIGSAVAAGGCLAARVLNVSSSWNAIASFGTGFFTQSAIEAGFKGKNLLQIQRVTLTAFGQVSLFFLSQLYENSDDPEVQAMAKHTIIGLLGANVLMYLSRLYDQRAVQVESHTHVESTEPKLQKRLWCMNHKVTDWVKLGAAIGSGVAYFVVDDQVVKAVSSFGSFFWGAQILGGQALRLIDRKIDQHDSLEGTPFRAVKTVLNTIGFFAIPCVFVPWTAKPHTAARVAQLPIVGAIAGFFDQITFQSANERLKKMPVEKLPEFEVLNVPGKKIWEQKPRKCPIQYVAYRIWEVAVPVLSIGGLLAYTAWQEQDELDGDPQSKFALGAMFGGFVATYGLYKWVDLTWSKEDRRWLQDKLMCSLITGPRVFGVNPVYVYLVGTSAIALNSDAIDKQEDNVHWATIIAAWLSYGIAMGHELMQTSGSRRRPPFAWPMMIMLNGANTMRFSFSVPGNGGNS